MSAQSVKTAKSANKVPVIIVGGLENALSIVRSLGKRGIPVSVASTPNCQAFNSRFIDRKFIVPEGMRPRDYFKELLLGEESQQYDGSIMLACSDEGIEFIIDNHAALAEKYILDVQKPHLQKAMLDKQETLRMAKEAGIGIPEFWNIDSLADIEKIEDEITYPAIIKPIHSHLFQKAFDGKKLLQINNKEELHEKATEVVAKGLEFMISELIPGPDTLLSSYYTHIDDDGHALFTFTKRVFRRSPPNFGSGCFHETKWLPETAKTGEHFFRNIGFTGVANVEFKTDPRDGQLKIIECNARYTAGQELVTRSGMDISYMIYQFLTGTKLSTATEYKENLHYWYPREDIRSYHQLAARGELNFLQWVKSIAYYPTVFPYFSLTDPKPSMVLLRNWFFEYLPWK